MVGFLAARPVLTASPAEVELAFDVALADLAADDVFREEHWVVPGRVVWGGDGSFPVWFFELADDTVWGATARMLVELLRLVLAVVTRRPGGARRTGRDGIVGVVDGATAQVSVEQPAGGQPRG